MSTRFSWASLVTPCILAGMAFAQSGGGYDLTWSTLDGGGGTSAGGAYTLSGTIGQPDATAAAAMTGGDYTLTGGFWTVVMPACTTFVPPDFDLDCDVDGTDFDVFNACVSGPELPYDPVQPPSGCGLLAGGDILPADFDADGDVDGDDFGLFQRCYSGASYPADPACGD